MKSTGTKILFSTFALTIAACSGGGGSGGGGSSAKGVLSLPNATCGSQACVSSPGFINSMASDSQEVLLANASLYYQAINESFIPTFNSKVKQIEALFANEGYTQCGGAVTATDGFGAPQVDQIPDGFYPLGTEYHVIVSSGSLRPNMEKKFVVKTGIIENAGTGLLEAQLGCPSETERYMYARLIDTSANYEVYLHETPSEKTIYAAADEGEYRDQHKTLYFKSTSPTRFEITAVLNNATVENMTGVDQAISGGADLAADHLDIQMTFKTDLSIVGPSTGGTFHANGVGDSLNNIQRHCYKKFQNAIELVTDNTCDGLYNGAGTSFVRGSSVWTIGGMGAAISTNF